MRTGCKANIPGRATQKVGSFKRWCLDRASQGMPQRPRQTGCARVPRTDESSHSRTSQGAPKGIRHLPSPSRSSHQSTQESRIKASRPESTWASRGKPRSSACCSLKNIKSFGLFSRFRVFQGDAFLDCLLTFLNVLERFSTPKIPFQA